MITVMIPVVLLACILVAAYVADHVWRRADALDGLLDPRVLRPVRERVRKLRASR